MKRNKKITARRQLSKPVRSLFCVAPASCRLRKWQTIYNTEQMQPAKLSSTKYPTHTKHFCFFLFFLLLINCRSMVFIAFPSPGKIHLRTSYQQHQNNKKKFVPILGTGVCWLFTSLLLSIFPLGCAAMACCCSPSHEREIVLYRILMGWITFFPVFIKKWAPTVSVTMTLTQPNSLFPSAFQTLFSLFFFLIQFDNNLHLRPANIHDKRFAV